MTDGTPMADEPADLHRTAKGIIAARDARIALLVEENVSLVERQRGALAAARVSPATLDDALFALTRVRIALGGDR